ncbi:uncharacterized protein IWZ02DRAFT_283522 [Phyllosticta citriasiana]|uniref:uncharacterized protein n=1 Tax=Phyllosticta citriasiana TaxID=595635 RepID=UPI0030FD2A2D
MMPVPHEVGGLMAVSHVAGRCLKPIGTGPLPALASTQPRRVDDRPPTSERKHPAIREENGPRGTISTMRKAVVTSHSATKEKAKGKKTSWAKTVTFLWLLLLMTPKKKRTKTRPTVKTTQQQTRTSHPDIISRAFVRNSFPKRWWVQCECYQAKFFPKEAPSVFRPPQSKTWRHGELAPSLTSSKTFYQPRVARLVRLRQHPKKTTSRAPGSSLLSLFQLRYLTSIPMKKRHCRWAAFISTTKRDQGKQRTL